MEQLLTKKNLAEHWQVTIQTIDSYIKDGLITPCNKVPCKGRFNPKYIAELDGVKLEKFSPLERRRLERELEFWKTKAEELERTITKLSMDITQAVYSMQKEA
jgi:predicted site-specific integrase-resolvase